MAKKIVSEKVKPLETSKEGKAKEKSIPRYSGKSKRHFQDKREKGKDMSLKREVQDKREMALASQPLSYSLAFWGLALLLFFPPYFRGLFFQTEQERALIVAAVVFWLTWLWKYFNRDNTFLSRPIDYFFLALPGVYLLSSLGAVNSGYAVDEVVKTILYFLVFWISSRLVRNEEDIINILHVIYLSAVGVALAGLATATGIIHIKDGFIDDRIYSSFQYPNALASFLGAVFILGIYLWLRSTVNYRYIYALGNFFLLAVLFGTKSNGGLLVFAVALLLFIIGIPKNNRLAAAVYFVFILIPAGLVIGKFISYAMAGKYDLAWLWIILGMALVSGLQFLYSFSKKVKLPVLTGNRKFISYGLATLAILATVAVFWAIQHDLIQKIYTEIRVRNALERVYFYQDALKMIADRPLLGWGGGGWQEAYRSYQSYLYNSNQVHSYYFQVGVETGIIGLLIIIGIWACFFHTTYSIYRNVRDNPSRRLLLWSLTVGAVAIGAHALIDFDLALSALAIVLWTLFGFVVGLERVYATDKEKKDKKRRYVAPNNASLSIVTVVSVAIIFFSGSLAVAGNYAQQAGSYLQAQNFNQGIEYLKKAKAYNPFNSEYYGNLARAYNYQGNLKEGLAQAQETVARSIYSAANHSLLASLYFSNGKYKEAVKSAEETVSLAPFQVNWYEFLARIYVSAGVSEVYNKKPNEAKKHFQEAIKIPDRIEKQMSTLSAKEKKLWNVASLMSPTPVVKVNLGIAQYFLGNFSEAERNLEAGKTQEDALLWLSILKYKQGKIEEAKKLLQDAAKTNPRYENDFEALKDLPLVK